MNKILLLLFISFALSTTTTAQYSRQDFQQLMQLEGTWAVAKLRSLYESWHQVNDTLIVGWRFSENGGDTTLICNYNLTLIDNQITLTHTFNLQDMTEQTLYSLSHIADNFFCFEKKQSLAQKIAYEFITSKELRKTESDDHSTWILQLKKSAN